MFRLRKRRTSSVRPKRSAKKIASSRRPSFSSSLKPVLAELFTSSLEQLSRSIGAACFVSVRRRAFARLHWSLSLTPVTTMRGSPSLQGVASNSLATTSTNLPRMAGSSFDASTQFREETTSPSPMVSANATALTMVMEMMQRMRVTMRIFIEAFSYGHKSPKMGISELTFKERRKIHSV